MLSPSNLRILLCGQPADMRKSFNGLSGMCNQFLSQDPTSGQVFVFFNKRRDQVKALWWDETGYAIWHKRLEAGMFHPDPTEGPISHAQLSLILDGIQVKMVRQYKRFHLVKKMSDSSI
ncbi:MAG: IS66 family insertion sequence element accessory protein TnpB [Fibrobacteres bacterium]|jgi:transposase|nr:IS66 family insertion sequence element accessory protein TnpB [Fibrobacterota bacterium]MBK8802608.1 IS66 family insertion sequence element accessory protein TnpB [Fibrobacterota bacterium]